MPCFCSFYLTIIFFDWWLQLYIMAQNSEAGQVNAPGFSIEKWNCLANILISAYHAANRMIVWLRVVIH